MLALTWKRPDHLQIVSNIIKFNYWLKVVVDFFFDDAICRSQPIQKKQDDKLNS